MKFLQIFNKTPNYKKFNYTPRFYKPEEEAMQERVQRIERELNKDKPVTEEKIGGDMYGHRERIRGSFRAARGEQAPQGTSSPVIMRLAILLVLTVGLIMYLQYGPPALYGTAIFIGVFVLYSRLKNSGTRRR